MCEVPIGRDLTPQRGPLRALSAVFRDTHSLPAGPLAQAGWADGAIPLGLVGEPDRVPAILLTGALGMSFALCGPAEAGCERDSAETHQRRSLKCRAEF
jgi:hypothetical protein